jgi:hypothetical protein
MKLRFRGNSLRLRVNRREVETLANGSAVEERIVFPGDASLAYVLEASAAAPGCIFEQGVIRVSAPPRDLANWAANDEVGLYFELPANGSLLKIAIEKDLECVDGPMDERDPEAFPRVEKVCR